MAYKQDKVSVSILKYVSDIIQFELKSSEIGFITVTGVEVTGDLSIAKIFVSFLDNKNVERRFEALNRCKGFIRSSLAKKLTIRKTPSLIFVIDDSFERGMKIEKLIKDINK